MAKQIKLGYTTILHEPRIRYGLSMNDYAVASLIYHLSNNPKAPIQGWCIASREQIGEFVGLSRRGVQYIIKELENIGLITIHPITQHLRTTDEWYENFQCFNVELGSAQPAQTLHTPEETPALPAQTMHTPSANIAPLPVQTMHTPSANFAHNNNIIIKDNDINKYKNKDDWFLFVFNSITKKEHKKLTKKTSDRFKDLLKNYSADEILKAITNASLNKFHLENNYHYLTPEFITRPEKFEIYLNAQPTTNGASTNNNSQNSSKVRTADSGGKKSFN